ncbi:kanadaptin [Brachionichthys hirsutus]|uniref:kanadaptin n=1 Tax=Brachionichthys hirsutus TaxID=412623 RepID=UPI003604D518
MAASSLSNLCVENIAEETHPAMEAGEFSATETEEEPTGDGAHKPEPEKEDIFKKPALFAAPSLAGVRSSTAAPSRTHAENNDAEDAETTREDSPSSDGEGEAKEKGREEDEEDAKAENMVPPKIKTEAKPRVVQLQPPPGGHFPPIPYTEPPWGGKASDVPYALEILKNGAIVDTVPLTQRSHFVVGRLPVCDVTLEHPSISRYHAVIQYRGQAGAGDAAGEETGFYLHDLGSTHGTVVNKSRIPPRTDVRLRVGHVLKFGGSTRLFVLQGPEFDEEEESELTVTELKERARKQRADLERRMTGGDSDEENKNEEEDDGDGETKKGERKPSNDDSGCSWGMAEEAFPEEDENEENPFSTEFQEDQEAAYLKDPKKALQGFYDREGEELEFEYEDKNHGSWLCRIKLPVDDALGRQLVAEVTHTGKKKEAAILCCLDACRMLEARGLLRQEAVSRKRKKKNWEDDDYYDSDDDTFLDRTGTVEKKRQERMKKAGKVEERPETYESLVSKLSHVEKELAETQEKLNAVRGGCSDSSAEDPLDAFMTAVRSEAAMDAVERKKLHLHAADLRKDAQRLRRLVELTRPTQMPSLLQSSNSEPGKPKKTLPLFGAMKGGSKFKLRTGTIGNLPPKRPNLPAELFDMKALSADGEEVEEEEGMHINEDNEDGGTVGETKVDSEESQESKSSGRDEQQAGQARKPKGKRLKNKYRRSRGEESTESEEQVLGRSGSVVPSGPGSKVETDKEPAAEPSARKKLKKKPMGPSKPPVQLSGQYPEDDPDYCVWMPPAGQTGDGRTSLNDKYGY